MLIKFFKIKFILQLFTLVMLIIWENTSIRRVAIRAAVKWFDSPFINAVATKIAGRDNDGCVDGSKMQPSIRSNNIVFNCSVEKAFSCLMSA